jgi:hypothetical protein
MILDVQAGISMSDTETPEAAAHEVITRYRLKTIEHTLQHVVETLAKLASIEEKHIATNLSLERAFRELTSQDDRIKRIELEMPTLKLVRTWVLTCIVGSFSLLVSILVVLITGFEL